MKKNPQMPSARRILGMVVGIVIIGLGIALFKQSHLGNDSISALNMRLAEMLGISLGVQNLCTNILFFALQFWFGRKYIGLGTLARPRRWACRCSCCGWRWRCRSRRWGLRCTRRQIWASPRTITSRWACGTTPRCRTSAAACSPMHCVRCCAGCWAALWASVR